MQREWAMTHGTYRSRLDASILALALGLAWLSACNGGSEIVDPGPDRDEDAGGAEDAGTADGGAPDPLGRDGSWDARFTIAGFSGMDGLAPQVFDFARSADGEVLAAGYFSYVGATRVDPLARRAAMGWTSFDDSGSAPAPAGGFSAVGVGPTGQIALAEYSGPFGGTGSYALWLKDGKGVREIGRFEGTIRSLAFHGEKLWAAGFFSMPNGIESLAVWDGDSWGAPPGGAVNGPVYMLRTEGEALLAAGGFTQIGGITAHSVASWNGASWTAFDLENARVFSVLRVEGQLFAGGVGIGGVAQLTGDGWEPLGGGLHQLEQDGQGVVSDIVVHQGDLYAIGCFRAAGGASAESPRVQVDSIARWTGTRWEALSTGGAPIASSFFQFGVCGYEPNEFTLWDMTLQRLFNDGAGVFIGGSFPGIAGELSQSVIMYDGVDYVPQGQAGDGLMGSAASVAVGGPEQAPHIFGGVTHAGETTSASGVFRLGAEGWQAVGGALPDGLICSVTAGGHNLAVAPDGSVYLGCSREEAGAPPLCTDCPPVRPVILALVDGAFEELPALALPGAPDDLAIDGMGRLWAAGGVRTGDATGAGWVVRWDGEQFTVVEDGFNSMVFRMAFVPGDDGAMLVVGGSFTKIGDADHARIARRAAESWEPLGPELNTAVLAIAVGNDGSLYAATAAESERYYVLARWDGVRWSELATPVNGLPAPAAEAVHQVTALAVVDQALIVGGSLLPAADGDEPFANVARNLFVFDGERFSPLGGGLKSSSVDSVAIAADGAWFVGSLLAEAGSGDARKSSVGIAHWSWAQP
jgi:hypothetical protein